MSVRMNALILETTKARYLGLGMQIPEIITQRKFISAMCHAYSNAQKLWKTVAPRLLVLDLKFYWNALISSIPITWKSTGLRLTIECRLSQPCGSLRSRSRGGPLSEWDDRTVYRRGKHGSNIPAVLKECVLLVASEQNRTTECRNSLD